MGGAPRAGVPAAGQGAAEAHRLRRVPQHPVQLLDGRRRRREVRRHARAAQREQHRQRPAAARPGLGHQPRRPGREPGAVPHRRQRRAGHRRQDPEPAHPAAFRESVRCAEQNLYARAKAAGRRPRPAPARVHGPAARLRRRQDPAPSSASAPSSPCAAPCCRRASGAASSSSASSTSAAPSSPSTTPSPSPKSPSRKAPASS